MYRFQQKLKNIKKTLKLLNKQTFGSIFDSQKQLSRQMDEIQHQIREQGLTNEIKALELRVAQQIEDRKRQEEILWKKKSRIQWLMEGECNTKFFYQTIVQRRHSNKITHLISDEGETLHSHANLETNLINYFQNLLTDPIPDRQSAINKITRHIPSLVTQEKTTALLRPFTIEEVDQALQDTPKCKAPDPDGFTNDFFHYCWPMIRTKVWEILEDSRVTRKVLQALNPTFLTLVTKEGQAHRAKQY
jgi:hypothetical protein